MRRLNLEVVQQGNLYVLATESNLYDRIVTAQCNDEDIQNIKQKLAEGDPKYTCSRVRYLPPDESKPFEVGRCTPTFVDTHVEVG
jgi:hypothetical protein